MVGKILLGYDGKTAWTTNPLLGPQVIDAKTFEAAGVQDPMQAMADYEKLFKEIVAIGKEEFNGAPAWSDLGAQFCLELAFGVLLALAFVPKAPVGRFFYRLMGSAALVPLLVAGLLPTLSGGLAWTEPAVPPAST